MGPVVAADRVELLVLMHMLQAQVFGPEQMRERAIVVLWECPRQPVRSRLRQRQRWR